MQNGVLEMKQELALELYDLCRAEQPDLKRAKEIICSGQIDLSAPAKADGTGCYLTEAIESFNYEIAELLLTNGADPNARAQSYGSALWKTTRFYDEDLEDEPKADVQKHLKTAQLLLECGADPNGLEGSEEPVLDDVIFRLFNDPLSDIDFDYTLKAVILLAAYGASTDYCRPEIIKPMDKSNLDQYRFNMRRNEDGYHLSGVIEDADGEVVAYI